MHPITNTVNFIIFDFNVIFSCSIKRTMKYIPENSIVKVDSDGKDLIYKVEK